jgi:hypothetical protein
VISIMMNRYGRPLSIFAVALSSYSIGCGGAEPIDFTGGAGGTAGSGGSGASGGATTASGGAGGGTGGSSGTAGAGGEAPAEKFSFFVTSLVALQELSGSAEGFGGDLRFGETGPGAGLRGADKICATIAEKSMPGAGRSRGGRSSARRPTRTAIR